MIVRVYGLVDVGYFGDSIMSGFRDSEVGFTVRGASVFLGDGVFGVERVIFRFVIVIVI